MVYKADQINTHSISCSEKGPIKWKKGLQVIMDDIKEFVNTPIEFFDK